MIIIVSEGDVMKIKSFFSKLKDIMIKYPEPAEEDLERIQIVESFPETKIRATVSDMQCTSTFKGTKYAKNVNAFIIIFTTEDNETLKVNVDEEMYLGFDIGMKGIITFSGDAFYSFEPDV